MAWKRREAPEYRCPRETATWAWALRRRVAECRRQAHKSFPGPGVSRSGEARFLLLPRCVWQSGQCFCSPAPPRQPQGVVEHGTPRPFCAVGCCPPAPHGESASRRPSSGNGPARKSLTQDSRSVAKTRPRSGTRNDRRWLSVTRKKSAGSIPRQQVCAALAIATLKLRSSASIASTWVARDGWIVCVPDRSLRPAGSYAKNAATATNTPSCVPEPQRGQSARATSETGSDVKWVSARLDGTAQLPARQEPWGRPWGGPRPESAAEPPTGPRRLRCAFRRCLNTRKAGDEMELTRWSCGRGCKRGRCALTASALPSWH